MNEYPTVQSAEALLSLSSLLNPKVPGDSSDDDMVGTLILVCLSVCLLVC